MYRDICTFLYYKNVILMKTKSIGIKHGKLYNKFISFMQGDEFCDKDI